MDKPDLDSIDGLSPAVSIDQKTTSKNPRSTVGTVTEDLRLSAVCCLLAWERRTVLSAVASLSVRRPIRSPIRCWRRGRAVAAFVLAPVVRGRKGEYAKLFEDLRAEGFSRVRVDGEVRSLDDPIDLDKKFKHDIEVVVDRIVIRENSLGRHCLSPLSRRRHWPAR